MSVGQRLATLFLAGLPLVACGKAPPTPPQPPLNVVAQKVAFQTYEASITLTGAVRARVQTQLSFRVTGRVIERKGDVGQHVEADAILAELDPSVQEADVAAATAALTGAEATLRQALAVYERQKALLAKGFTTQASYDAADRSRLTAEGSLDTAKAQLVQARDALTYTKLRAGHAGVITDRFIEIGQVAQAGEAAFGFAEDGPRDAVFQVYESLIRENSGGKPVDLELVSDPRVKASGKIREISPSVDSKSGTVQVKVEIDSNAPAMPLGAAVSGEGRWLRHDIVVVPWTSIASKDGSPAVWVVDPVSNAVSLRTVGVAVFEKEKSLLRSGLREGELVVTEGGKFLREGQIVHIENPERP
jgi:membrane fusion protein, multidrug efflux system